MKTINRLLLLSFLVLVLGIYSGCSSDGAGTGGTTGVGGDGVGGDGGGDGVGDGVGARQLDTVYVDASASPSGDGTSWTKAFNNLQAGINAAADKVSGNGYVKVHVAVGTYKPNDKDSSNLDRTQHFALKNNVYVHGGYPKGGGDSATGSPSDTILSGDLKGDDDPNNEQTKNDNAHHVFYHPEDTRLDNTAKLLNVTITKGNADGGGNHSFGGGMYNQKSYPMLTNCEFINNKADLYGGGIYNEESSPKLTNCEFTGNSAGHYGGGMYNQKSSPKLTNCEFNNNNAKEGGGMRNFRSSPKLTKCIFTNNTATDKGGAIHSIVHESIIHGAVYPEIDEETTNSFTKDNTDPNGKNNGIFVNWYIVY